MSWVAVAIGGSAVIGAGASMYSANKASNTSKDAAADTYAKQQAAVGDLRQAGDRYANNVNSLGGGYQPYIQAGQSSLKQLMGGLGLGGEGGSQDFTNAYHSLPGYQSGLETGQNTAIRGLNAGGRLQSGATMKALQRYGSNYEDQRSGDYLNRLMAMQSQGLSATGQQAGLGVQAEQGRLGALQTGYGGLMQSAGTVGQGQVAGAQTEQNALQNVMGMGAYLGGSYLGGNKGNLGTGGFQLPGKGAYPSG